MLISKLQNIYFIVYYSIQHILLSTTYYEHAEREREMQSEKVELSSIYSDMELSERIFKISRINRLKT